MRVLEWGSILLRISTRQNILHQNPFEPMRVMQSKEHYIHIFLLVNWELQ